MKVATMRITRLAFTMGILFLTTLNSAPQVAAHIVVAATCQDATKICVPDGHFSFDSDIQPEDDCYIEKATILWGDSTSDSVQSTGVGINAINVGDTFSHQYATPKFYSVLIQISLRGTPNTFGDIFCTTLGSVTGTTSYDIEVPGVGVGVIIGQGCSSQGAQLSGPVILPQVDTKVVDPVKPYSIRYGELPLTFTSAAPNPNSSCTLVSNSAALPVILRIYAGNVEVRAQIASSVTQATLDFLPNTSVSKPRCDFSLLSTLAGYTGVLPSSTRDCYLNSASTSPNSMTVKWSIPGFIQHSPNEQGPVVYQTPPLTYYVDLDSFFSSANNLSFQDIVQQLETFIHQTLIANLPSVDVLGLVQDPPAHVFVTDPLGKKVGYSTQGIVDYPGAGYLEVGDRSIVWILEPVRGSYKVDAIASPGQAYTLSFSKSSFLGRNNNPAVEITTTSGIIPANGVDQHTFSINWSIYLPTLHR